MGVTGLWKLIEPCGKPVPVDLLEGKILAVDISIWLHQVVKGFQDSKGSALNNAHLLGLFHRLCKLLYYRVKPVFVFDGCVPQIKRDTIARRIQQRNKLNNEAERIQSLLLQSLAKEKVVQQALGANTELLLKCGNKKTTSSIKAKDDADDIFRLPILPSTSNSHCAEEDKDGCKNGNASFSTDTDSSFEESNKQHAYFNNLQAIDVRSKHFKNLPADVRHEILVDIKETRKQSSWGRLHELPSSGDDFSKFQMQRLLKRRAVQESLEEAEQEMGGRSLTFSELQNFFTEEGIVEPSKMEEGTKQICSDENTRILLVRDLKKKFKNIAELETDLKKIENSQLDGQDAQKIEESKQVEKQAEINTNESECNVDLELAIALSLEESQVYKEVDYEYEGHLKLNKEQRSQLKNAAVGPARNYMIEYGGMNDEEVDEIMNKTQLQTNPEEDEKYNDLFEDNNEKIQLRPAMDGTEFPSLFVSDEDETKSDIDAVVDISEDNPSSQELNLLVSDKSETDSDMEIVFDNTNDCDSEVGHKIEIVLDINEPISLKDDLFCDIFGESHSQSTFKNEIDNETKKNDSKEEAIPLSNLSEEFISETPTMKEEKSIFEKFRSPGKSRKGEESEEKQQKPDLLVLLDELKTQVNVVQHINLEDIKLNNSVIELSDDEKDRLTDKQEDIKLANEIVQIYDSEDNLKSSKKDVSKSPKCTTPSKEKRIIEYFEPEYIVKRKSEQKNNESTPPQVIPPFFASKSPKSKSTRENKKTTEEINKNKSITAETINNKIESHDVINEAASALRESKSTDELESMAVDLAQKRLELESERNRQDRMGMTISQRMNLECQELLRLFGIPYIIAPMEAEAQCAFLDAAELTNGTITDDSDIWLFGGRTVYKNFFAQNKHVLEYRSEQIEKSFNCDRKKLIELACLVGSDYTPGIHGIGAVTALEIIASFTACAKEKLPDTNSSNTIKFNILSSLRKFRDWWLAHKSSASPPGTTARMNLLKKLKNIELDEGFPSQAVVEAYLTPEVDNSKDPFSWGYPDVQSIREFAKRSFGWTNSKTDDILNPVLKKLNEKNTQSTIKNYFSTKTVRSQNQLKLSKRLQNAISTMTGNFEEQNNKPPEPKKKRRTRISRRELKPNEATSTNTEEASTLKVNQAEDACCNELTSRSQPMIKTSTKKPRIPNSKQVFSQLERHLEEMNKNKEKAVEIMKKVPSLNKKKRII